MTTDFIAKQLLNIDSVHSILIFKDFKCCSTKYREFKQEILKIINFKFTT